MENKVTKGTVIATRMLKRRGHCHSRPGDRLGIERARGSGCDVKMRLVGM